MALLIIGGTLLVNSPRVQRRVSVLLATELENRIGTRVGLGGVHWLFPNDIVIDSLTIDDQEGEQLLSVSRLAAKVEWMPLIRHRQLSIRNVRLFHPDIHIYKADAADEYNYQFLIDAFASKKEKRKEPSRLSLRINTLLIRHAHVCHRIASPERGSAARFDPANLSIDDLSTQLSLKHLSTDSVSLIVRHLSLKEQSGLNVDDLYFRLVGNRQGATLANFQLDLPHSSLRLDTVWVAYKASPGPSQGGVTQTSQPTIDSHLSSWEYELPSTTSHPSSGGAGGGLIIKGAIRPSHLTPADLGALLPEVAGITEKIHFDADFIGSPSRINLKALNIHSAHRDLVLRAESRLSLQDRTSPAVTLDLHEATITYGVWALLQEQAPELYALIPQEVIRMGSATATGALRHDAGQTTLDLQAATDAGSLKAQLKLDSQGNYTATLDGEDIKVAQIIPESPLVQTDIALKSEGCVDLKIENSQFSILNSQFTAKATHAHLLGYEYGTIALDGEYTPESSQATLTLDDPNGALLLDAAYHAGGRVPRYTATLRADSLNLHAMQLIDIHESATFSTRLSADLAGDDIDHLMGKVIVDSLTMHRPSGDFLIKDIDFYSNEQSPGFKTISLHTDFMDGSFSGNFTYGSLANSLLGHLHHSLPSLCQSGSHVHESADNLCVMSMVIENTEPLRQLLLVPIELEGKAEVKLTINDTEDWLELDAKVPRLNYDGKTLRGISLDCSSSEEMGLELSAGATLQNEGGVAVTANLDTWAMGDRVDLGVRWSSDPTDMFMGAFRTQAALISDVDGNLGVNIATDSMSTVINRSEWKLAPFNMLIFPGSILIDGFHFANGDTQHLIADGVIAHNGTDTLQVDFDNLDLGYLLSLVKLEGISFDGQVSGHADMANLYSDRPYVEAAVDVQDFSFCNGPMGDLKGDIHWNQEEGQLQFTSDVWEDPRHTSVIDGTVDLKRNELWLDIAADNINVSFLNSMLGSFMTDIKGHATGNILVGGPMDAIDLDGALLTDAAFKLIPTNVDYRFRDSLRFKPGVIELDGIRAIDHRGHTATVEGAVTHNKLSDYAYDLSVDVDNALGIDLPETGQGSFYTTIYGKGGVHINGGPGAPLAIEIEAQPMKGSSFALNLASQDVSSSEAFITFTDRSAKRNVPVVATRPSGRRRSVSGTVEESSPLDLSILAHITPDAVVELVMNQATNDHISVFGNGDLQINILNDDINLHGTYTVSHGSYRLSLQDVINKNFEVLAGSTVSFEGDPMAAKLNITAQHVVNYVPLKDLSPEMTGNVHVNCLLYITGTLNAPKVTFGLELPKATEEEKAVLRSYTGTDEQTNLQFIYLLGLGKFYTPDMAMNAETGGNGNVESFINSTISGQINSILSSIISNDNWNIASNIRSSDNLMTGGEDFVGDELAEDGLIGNNWNNMEIEGILEGRLLDNRLLINGSFGYRDNPLYATNFIGDFDIRYRLTGGLSLKGYNKTNDRYFSRTSLTTQGIGLVFQRDFDRLFPRLKKKQKP